MIGAMSLLNVTSFFIPELAIVVDNTTRAAAGSAKHIDSTLFISCPTIKSPTNFPVCRRSQQSQPFSNELQPFDELKLVGSIYQRAGCCWPLFHFSGALCRPCS